MPTVNLSFPDPSYSETVRPSIVTIKADLTLIETAINALDDDNIAANAGILASKLDLTNIASAVRFNNDVQLQFEDAAGAADCFIKELPANDLVISIGTDNKLSVNEAGTVAKFQVDHGDDMVKVRDGYTLRVQDSTDSDFFDFLHDGIDAHIDVSAGGLAINTQSNQIIPVTTDQESLGIASKKWSDVQSTLINGVSFLVEKDVTKWLDKEDTKYPLPRLIEFTWKNKNKANQGRTFMGFAADDMPDTIANEEGKTVNLLGAVAYGYGAIKQLMKKVETLEIEINLLRG